MNEPNPLVRNISDTARWVAYFRARETERPDALFRDPYAERLAGERGFQIANTLPEGNKHEWAWAARTYLFDEFLSREIQEGVDLVVNLAAGLDARPYRMQLPATLRWAEVDLPEILSYKEAILAKRGTEMPAGASPSGSIKRAGAPHTLRGTGLPGDEDRGPGGGSSALFHP